MSERMIATQPFDGQHVGALDLRERHEAGADRLAVHEHGARATLAFAASFFRSRELALLADHVQEPRHGMRVDVGDDAVQRESHTTSPSWRMAFTTAGAGPSTGSSPRPLAPNGPPTYGFSNMTMSSSGVSS